MLTAIRRWCGFAAGTLMLTVLAGCGLSDAGDPAATVLPPADAEPGRWVILEGANNTRDIGGYIAEQGRRVRWNTVYRSGELTDLTPAGCDQFRSLGVQVVVDFRNRLLPCPLFGGDAGCVYASTRSYVFPVSADEPPEGVPAYVYAVQTSAESYRRTFEMLADPANLPLMYHCAAGKDRTGIMTALLLTLLGVDRDTVMADYSLSEQVGATIKPQAMAALLDEVDRQGGIEGYLADIGVPADTRTAIRDLLLEDPD